MATTKLTTDRQSLRPRLRAALFSAGLTASSALAGLTVTVLPGAAAAQTSAPSADVARLQAEVARLDRELREQKQLLLQVMQADQQRYDMVLQLLRSSSPATVAAAAAAATPSARNEGAAAGGAGPSPAATPAAATSTTLTGTVRLPRGVQEAYVYLEGHGPTRARALEIKQQAKQFSPQVAVVPVGSKVSFPNADTVFHNVFSRTPGTVFDLGTVKGGEKPQPVTLTQPGHVEIFCNIHSRMRADVLVVPNGYYTKVRPDGSFALAGVPVGSRKLVLWGAGLKPASQMVEIRPGATVNLTGEAGGSGAHMNKNGEAYRSYDE
jgi:plastocyanin